MDLDLRLVRGFAAVATTEHFGRAAETLKMTQPALSRQVRRLEDQLGVLLLSRTSRRVELTPTGRDFLEQMRPVLAATDQAIARARRAERGTATLAVGFMGGIDTSRALESFHRSRPDVEVTLLHLEWWEQAESLHDGRVDIAFVRPPIELAGLRMINLFTEPRMVLLPARHRFATKESISILDIADEEVVAHRHTSPAWDAYWSVDPRPDGSHPRRGATVQTVEEKLEQVALGNSIAFMPKSASAYYSHPGVRYVELHDVAPCPIAIAWASNRRNKTLSAFAHAAQQHPG